jgi:hypothetical protein
VFYLAVLLFHLLSEPELGNNMSTIGELSKRLLSRRPNVEPILSQQFLQQGTNILVETSETRSTSVDQDDEDKTNSSADHKGKSKALEADFVSAVNSTENNQEREKKRKGNKSKKKKSGKGGRKR